MHKTREKKKEERIRLKTNGFGRRRRIVASPYTVFLSRVAVSQESEHLAVALVHNTSEVSELLSHHFLSPLERTKLSPKNVPFRETTRSPSRYRSSLSATPAFQTKTRRSSREAPDRARGIAKRPPNRPPPVLLCKPRDYVLAVVSPSHRGADDSSSHRRR